MNETKSVPGIELPEVSGLSKDHVRTLMNCRTLRQYMSMIDDYNNGKCPFCDPLDKKNVIIKENDSWRMWRNPFALKHTRIHLIMAHKHHARSAIAMDDDTIAPDFYDAGNLFSWACKEFQIRGGCFAMRFGSPEFNAGSVLHLHTNIIVPDGTGAVQVTLAKEPEKVLETIARMKIFEKLRSGIRLEELSIEEAALVRERLG